jgi:hypothetical protein
VAAARRLSGSQAQWDAVAELVVERRQRLGIGQDDVVALSDNTVSKSVISLVENGRQLAYASRTMAGLARGLGWTADSIERILRGEEPDDDDEAMIALVERRGGRRVPLAGRTRATAALSGTIDVSDLSEEDRVQIEALVDRLRRSAG